MARPSRPSRRSPSHCSCRRRQTFQLTNGLTVILSERRNLPIVSAALVFRTGSDANPLDKPGLANFTVAMLDEGTTSRNALQLADDVAQIGATLETSSTMDLSRVQVRSLKRIAPTALNILADVVLRPTFLQDEVERQRGQRISQLADDRQNPPSFRQGPWRRRSTARDTPTVTWSWEPKPSIRQMTRADMIAFWKANFVPNNAALIVAGDIGSEELRKLAQSAFGDWPPGTVTSLALGLPGTTKSKAVVVDKPGAAQTVLRVASIGVPRSTPDYAALEVMNASLGGLFSSRINMNLREEHGYTYGAGSVFRYRRGAGPFFVATGVRSDVTGASVKEIFKEIDRMITAPLTAEELALSRDSLVRSLPGQFETSSQVLSSFADVYVFNLGMDYFQRFPQQVNAVTTEAVQDVARRHLIPDRMVVVAVGDRAKIDPQLREVGLGSLELRDSDGNVVRSREMNLEQSPSGDRTSD